MVSQMFIAQLFGRCVGVRPLMRVVSSEHLVRILLCERLFLERGWDVDIWCEFMVGDERA